MAHVVLCALLMLAVAQTAHGQAKVPVTVEDHLALAKSYQDKAAAWKKEAQYHRDMAEQYKKSAVPGDKSGKPNPWVKKMSDHCQAISDDAEKLAADALKAAEYHTFRAKELQGK
jgi:hypothetical protein